MTKKQHYSWEHFDRDTKKLARKLSSRKDSFDGIWAPPRGGLPIAVVLSHALDLPLLAKPKSTHTLIVDDIADTGKTLQKYAQTHTIATLFYHPQSTFEPHIWIRKKNTAWIIFPWEKTEKII